MSETWVLVKASQPIRYAVRREISLEVDDGPVTLEPLPFVEEHYERGYHNGVLVDRRVVDGMVVDEQPASPQQPGQGK